ncbi:hypothetical protein BG000_009378 [Podila horticola]|nr:hypothetical protein BG000_009378 [Podila horticola]
MGKLSPFCLANDGNTVYVIAYAYLVGPTAPTAPAEPDNIILAKSNRFDTISTTTSNPLQDVTWTTLSVVNRSSLNQLRPGYTYGYSCGVSAFDPKHPANFVFTLHVDLKGSISNSPRFSLQFWREGASTSMAIVNSRLNEDKEIQDLSAKDYWSSAHSSNAALFPLVLDSRMVKSPIAASFNNKTMYVWETEPRHAIITIPTLSAASSTANELALSQPASRSLWRNITLSTPDASVVQARIAVNGPLIHLLRFEETLEASLGNLKLI